MASEQYRKDPQKRAELDERARRGETVVPGGTGGKSLQAQEQLAQGRQKGGETRREQIGHEGYHEMGKKGGLSTSDKSGGERACCGGRHHDRRVQVQNKESLNG